MGVFFTAPYRLLDVNNNLLTQAPSITLTGTHNPGESGLTSQPKISVASSWYCSLTRLQEIRTAYGSGYVTLATLKNGCKIRLKVTSLDSSSIGVGVDIRDSNNNNIGSGGFSQLILSGDNKFEGVDILFFGDSYYSAQGAICRHTYTDYFTVYDFSQTQWTTLFINTKAPDDPYGLQENDTLPGGYAGFDYTGDNVDIPALPTISAAASGFVRLYNPTIGEVQSLASYLWSGAFDLATYKKLFGNPMDCFLSFGIIPVTPPRSVNKEAISFANMPDPGVTAYKLTSQFAEFDCGSVSIDGSKYTGSAMDYSPYTKAELFLPFCGTHSLAVDDIMDSTISIKYHMDLYTGACVAYVKITRTNSDGSTLDSVLYQFTGNILATIPLTGADHSNFIQSMLFMGAAVAATVATAGGAAPEIGGAMAVGDSVSTSALGGAAISASGINAVMSMKPNVIRSGNLSANAGFLGLKKPVITLTCPNLCRPEDENKLAGMPCQKSGTLSEFNGFNIIGACHLDNIPCTMEELRMIDAALAKGVIV